MVSTRHHPRDFPQPSATGVNTHAEKDQNRYVVAREWRHTPSVIVTLWLCISIPVVLWDASYVLLRPHSMPGGSLHYIWSPYALYGTIDYIYGWPAWNNRNGFTSAQSLMNLVETACYLFYLFVLFNYGTTSNYKGENKGKSATKGDFFAPRRSIGGRLGAIALLVVFSGSVMTVSKTVLYGLNEACSGFDNVGHNSFWTLIFLWIIPNGFWIVVPSYASFYFGNEILNAIEPRSGLANTNEDSKSK
ncbi:uncharacterized protein BDCG_00574 [Blastomyces dermatitidis ER-3]|uniref:C6 transcription factor n=3 Tax=Blastomyces TaxID=229219 RepID=A0A179UP38_BLAGS|nr:uncharacterized protein BDBG_05020 [Blastomyces gilchristii SLH14081]XP_045271889.1 uncharacterized protein BDCG_00574 [Blastomyces dermatitidis ER-3]EEQ83769.1 hypothetical protein BDCG_00574 [Blastomyces dermatitidis ER-3]EGE80105.1 hypothetical protein BDDG_03046 [Blastomyces dermatitidis ATCC 18188]OAT08791.1 hypothetical protein BDBG_05020 [Blastomyces gilchristii SLH14081]